MFNLRQLRLQAPKAEEGSTIPADRFAFKLFYELTHWQETANVSFSPFSVMLCLLMVWEGASAETCEGMSHVLEIPPVRNSNAPSQTMWSAWQECLCVPIENEISNIQKMKLRWAKAGNSDVTKLQCVKNYWMEFSVGTALKEQVDKAAQAKAAAEQPGSLQLQIQNSSKVDTDTTISVYLTDAQGKTIQETASGQSWARLNLLPGQYKIRIQATVQGKSVEDQKVVPVKPAETANVQLAL